MMVAALSVPASGVRAAPSHLAWCLVYYSSIAREKLHVRYLDDAGEPRDAELDAWLDYDQDSRPYQARIAWFPVDMDQDTRDELTADLFAHYTGESTDWEYATLAQVTQAVRS